MTQPNQDRLANLKLLLAQEKAGENNSLYIADLENSIAALEKKRQIQPDYQMVKT